MNAYSGWSLAQSATSQISKMLGKVCLKPSFMLQDDLLHKASVYHMLIFNQVCRTGCMLGYIDACPYHMCKWMMHVVIKKVPLLTLGYSTFTHLLVLNDPHLTLIYDGHLKLPFCSNVNLSPWNNSWALNKGCRMDLDAHNFPATISTIAILFVTNHSLFNCTNALFDCGALLKVGS